jgi:RNase P subunit RPR2
VKVKRSGKCANGARSQSILPQPLQVGLFRRCPHCKAWLSLEMTQRREDEVAGSVSIYRCNKCGTEAEFAERHPQDAI